MNINIQKTLFIILLVCLSGCASKPSKYAIKGYTSSPKISQAGNVIKAAGLPKIKDVKLSKHQRQLIDNNTTVVGSALYATTSTLSNLNKLGSAAFPVDFLVWSMMDAKGDLRQGRRDITWMPREMASTPEEAVEVMGNMYAEAIKQTMETIDLPEPYSIVLDRRIPKQRKSYDGKRYSYKYGYEVKGGWCDSAEGKKYPCSISGFYQFKTIDGDTMPYPGVAPDFLGGGDAWVFSRYTHFGTFFPLVFERSVEHRAETIGPILRELSKHLPPWNYIYSSHFYINKESKPLPLIFNSGKELLFIKPEKS